LLYDAAMVGRQVADTLIIIGLIIITLGTASQAILELQEYRDLFKQIPDATRESLIDQLPWKHVRFWMDDELSLWFPRFTRMVAFMIGISVFVQGGYFSFVRSVFKEIPEKMVAIPDKELPAQRNKAKEDLRRAATLARKATG
jgi:hypothetical protein